MYTCTQKHNPINTMTLSDMSHAVV